jgi:deazaflavin-dependent oxidoreductase (nitroreductase family)
VSVQGRILAVHQLIYERSNGRIGHRMLGVPTLLLRTTGRRTGATRTNALVYASDGDDYVVVASNGGEDRPPAWLLNLTAEPRVEVQVAGDRRPAGARVVERGDPDFERLWRLVNDNNSARYDGYQTKTQRPIPMVVVTPG